MNSLKTVAIAALLSTTAVGGAFAADAIGLPPPPPVAEMPVFDQGGFDWNGFYAGVSGGAIHNIDQDETNWTLGVQAGANAQFDMFVVGLEASVDAVFDDEIYAYAAVLGRAGVLVTDELLAYGAVGYGSDFDADEGVGDHILAGGGLEFAATNDVTIRGQYLYGWDQSNDTTSGDIHKVTLGANFHF
jgi:outer membrane immunogenic protein